MASKRMKEVRDMTLAGLTTRAIAERTGLRPSTVRVYRTTMGVSRPHGSDDPRQRDSLSLHLPADIASLLLDDAEERGISAAVLARRIISAVIADDLVGAVLDD